MERYSFVAMEIRNAPHTIPTISGLKYWTIAAECSFIEPAVSRIKQAIQSAMLAGFPRSASAAAAIPRIAPRPSLVVKLLLFISYLPLIGCIFYEPGEKEGQTGYLPCPLLFHLECIAFCGLPAGCSRQKTKGSYFPPGILASPTFFVIFICS